ncbi:hypothetical protein [Xanthomonas euvesicatoria]|uniref:DUF4435 domain-containing protein n=1 Tax=Xanthomonas euvesicatoria TaxID=456327 RepID=A0AAW3UC28_XANEU|nr:hypothetical protein [Xanthomonas euvesicatoria]MBB4725780.1 hypothetical protein [Xanthomonas euvesicatoria]MBB4872322.1 hypothetical protein [Xanthomonas euvesicatoria]
MTNLPKRTLSEILFYYKKVANRDGGDIFVEGAGDKLLLDTYIESRQVASCPVYTMDMIDFSGVDFGSLGLPAPSARSGVIALRKILKDENVDVSKHIFLVDRDVEDLYETPLMDGIELTDSGALPVHLYDNITERKFSDLVFEGKIDLDVLKNSVNAICTDVYLLRVAAKSLKLGIRILPPGDLITGSRVVGYRLDFREYVERCLNASQCIDRVEQVLAHAESSRHIILEKNLRKFTLINDHTLWDVLKIIGSRLNKSNNRSSKDIEELVRMTFDPIQLSGHRLFQAIENRVISSGVQAAQPL